jgi:putative ABC transport system permease protein
MSEIRYATRTIVKRPLFTAVVIITLALGIGANTAIFTVVDATLLRSLPYREPDRLVQISENTDKEASRRREASYPDFLDWKNNNSTLESVAGFNRAQLIISNVDSSEMVRAGQVSADFFHVLGVQPLLGRAITTGDDEPGANRVAVLTYGAWQQRFGADANVVGRTINTLNGTTFTVAGVLPPEFHFAPLNDAELFVPLNPSAESRGRRFMHFVKVIGRLNNGVTLPQAVADMNRVGAQIAESDPVTHANVTLSVLDLRDQIVGRVKPILLVLLIAVGFVLVIACANVANLFLVRSASRQKEMSVRLALGASRFQLARQLLIESLLLAIIGGALGLALARVGVDILVSSIPAEQLARMPYLRSLGLNEKILFYSIAISLLSGVLFALAPILQFGRLDLQSTLKEGGRTAVVSSRSRLRVGLVAGEIALTLVLMVGVGLMLKSTIRLLQVDPGFVTDNLLTLRLPLPDPPYTTESQVLSFHRQLLEKLRSLPGVVDAATVGLLPLNGGGNTSTPIIDGRLENSGRTAPSANVRTISTNYFATIGIPVIEGRTFTEQDQPNSPRAIVVNRTFEKTFFPDESPVGHRVTFIWDSSGKPWNIVGVVGDENVTALDSAVSPVIYFPFAQDPEPALSIVVRTRQEPLALAPAVRNEIRTLDRTLPVSEVTSMNALIAQSPSTFMRKYPAMLIGVFAALAMVLAAIGLYGVISYSVAQRTQELGVRIALGAQRRDIFRLVLGQGMWFTALGVGIGLAGAFMLTKFLRTLLFEVSPYDPLVITGVVLLMLIVSLIACYLPARRATKVDPLVALRYE